MLNIIFEALEFSPHLADAIEDATYVEGIFWYSSNIVTDFCCLLIPAAIVLPLELGLGKKLSVIALFGFGGIANAAAWWAFAFFLEVQARPDDEEHYFEDRIQVLEKNLILVFVECNGGIICAGIPTIWVFFTHFLPSMVRYYLHPSPLHVKLGDRGLDNDDGGGSLQTQASPPIRAVAVAVAVVGRYAPGHALGEPRAQGAAASPGSGFRVGYRHTHGLADRRGGGGGRERQRGAR
ncbi:hypothetical protein PG997_000661 [Apiospora hydei]|uniref:Rhodopsin domain-containing protein n=1 Tax=Apiospora hydei TaxID=1337664 RepID=A0ABR1XBF3_9PEZI